VRRGKKKEILFRLLATPVVINKHDFDKRNKEKFDQSVLSEQILIIRPCVEQFYTLNAVAISVAQFARPIHQVTKSNLRL